MVALFSDKFFLSLVFLFSPLQDIAVVHGALLGRNEGEGAPLIGRFGRWNEGRAAAPVPAVKVNKELALLDMGFDRDSVQRLLAIDDMAGGDLTIEQLLDMSLGGNDGVARQDAFALPRRDDPYRRAGVAEAAPPAQERMRDHAATVSAPASSAKAAAPRVVIQQPAAAVGAIPHDWREVPAFLPDAEENVFRVLIVGRTVQESFHRLLTAQAEELRLFSAWRDEILRQEPGSSPARLELVHLDDMETLEGRKFAMTGTPGRGPWNAVHVVGVCAALKGQDPPGDAAEVADAALLALAQARSLEDAGEAAQTLLEQSGDADWPARVTQAAAQSGGATAAGGQTVFHLVVFDFSVMKFIGISGLFEGLSDLPLNPSSRILLRDVALSRTSEDIRRGSPLGAGGGASLSDDGQESFLKKPSMELLFRTLEDRAGGGAPPTRRISVSPTWTVGQVKVL